MKRTKNNFREYEMRGMALCKRFGQRSGEMSVCSKNNQIEITLAELRVLYSNLVPNFSTDRKHFNAIIGERHK